MNLDLLGKHALVCGASEGIGRATAHELAALGADVTLLARRESALLAVRDTLPLPHAGQRLGVLAIDMADSAGLYTKVAELAEQQPIHIVLNNSGGPPGGPLSEAEPERLLQVFTQHVIAAQQILRAVLPGMRAAGYGRIINVISTSVKEPIAGLGVSNTVRGAMASWAKTLASELAADGITVNNVLPGFTETSRLTGIVEAAVKRSGRDAEAVRREMLSTVPAGRFAHPEETAAAIAFLASPAAGYINGINVPVDGGRTRSL